MSVFRFLVAYIVFSAGLLAVPAVPPHAPSSTLALPPGEITRQNLIYTAKLSTVVSALPDLRGKSFSIRAIDNDKTTAAVYKSIADHVATNLKKFGMIMPKDASAPTDYIVWLKTSVREINPDEFAQAGVVGIRFAKAEARDYERTLIVLVSDQAASGPGKPDILYKASISSTGPNPRIRGAMPGLLQMFFHEFPGKAGETKKYPDTSD